MLAPVAHNLALTSVRRERVLPVPGRITVRLDQKVGAMDVIAEARFGAEHLLVDVARTFDLHPEAAQNLLQVKAGDLVSKGDLIARGPRLGLQVIHSPTSGRVVLTGAGKVLLEVGDTSFELRAGMPGTISRLISERGAEIKFNGALVQGVWGNGQLNVGMLLPFLSTPDEALTAKRLDVSLRGSVLLVGTCNDPAALQVAGELPVRGIVLGSMSPSLIPVALQMQYPIVVIDGFGQRALNGSAYKLLSTNAKREATLNAEPFERHSGARPEIFISLPVAQDPIPPHEMEALAPDQTVRLTRDPHAGMIGTLVSLQPGLVKMPSGLRVAAANIRLDSGEQILVPLANLEVLG